MIADSEKSHHIYLVQKITVSCIIGKCPCCLLQATTEVFSYYEAWPVAQFDIVDLTTIHQVEPIYVTFSVPEAQLGDVKKYMAQGQLRVTAVTQDSDAEMESGRHE